MSTQVAAATPSAEPTAIDMASAPVDGPTPAELLGGVPYLGHAESDGSATVRILHHGVEHAVRGNAIRIHGEPRPGCTVGLLRVNQELRMVVLQ